MPRFTQLPNAVVGMVLLATLTYAGCDRNSADRTATARTAAGRHNVDCEADADCTVTNDPEGGCCSNCRCLGEAVGINKASYQAQENHCANMGACPCPEEKPCPTVEPASAFVARCRSGTCTAERK